MIINKQFITAMTLLTFYTGSAASQTVLNLEPNFMNAQLSEQLLNQTLAQSDPKLIKAQAELIRRHYQALIKTGFTKDEALEIVVAMASNDKN
jgi:hypothetical protein